MNQHQVWMVEPSELSQAYRPMRPRGLAGMFDHSIAVQNIEGVAVVPIDGVMARRASLETAMFGGTSTEELFATIDALGNDPKIHAILLRVDSPGGESQGTRDLSDAVERAAEKKQVVASVSGVGASAAYFAMSKASRIVAASPDARIGSIGTRLMLVDSSQAFENFGLKPVLIDTGSFKSIGVPGVEITEEQKQYLRECVNGVQQPFTDAVVKGRKLFGETLREVLTGKVYMASEAQRLGLIDAIEPFETTLNSVKPKQEKRRMSAPATYAELKSCLPGADSAFLCEAMEKTWSLDQAQSTWMERQSAKSVELQQKLIAQEQEIADLKAKAAKAATAASGVDPDALRETQSGTITDVRSEWIRRVQEEVDHGRDRAAAVQSVARKFPDLRQQLVAAAN